MLVAKRHVAMEKEERQTETGIPEPEEATV
jgi:hypothetical protein